jgi:GTP-binding protein LepA
VVFASIYPVAADDYDELAVALEKLKLNDASLIYEKDTSAALGFGFRCGFLGLLHLDVVQERLEREYDQSVILTVPSVQYRLILNDGTEMEIDNPAHYPDPTTIEKALEPFIRANIIIPDRYMGAVMKLCLDRRGINKNYQYLTSNRLEMTFELPLSEVIYDFYDKLKSVTQGYGSFDYEIIEYRESKLVKLDILINGERVDALSQLVHEERAYTRARVACDKLQEEIPAPAVQDRHPRCRGRQDHLARHRERLPQGRYRQVLWRRYHPQAKALGKAEKRQKAHEDGGPGDAAPERIPCRAQDRYRLKAGLIP